MKWDAHYSEPDYTYGTTPNDFLASVVDRIPHSRILSLAEGEGRNAVYLATLGYEVTAVDSSAVGLRKAEALAARRGITITAIHADLSDFTIERQQWDGVVSCYCHLPAAIRIPLHHAVVQGLKPGGVFVLEAFSKQQLGRGTGGPQTLDLLMSLDELMRELAGLQFIHAVATERAVIEGRCHTGLASVVQLLGVKP